MASTRVLIASSAFAGSLIIYDTYNPGLRRSIQFWSTLGPPILEYQSIKYKAQWEGEEGLKDLDRRLDEFHVRNAKRALGIITSLGGIYVKIGQFFATMGSGLLMDCYVQALLPLTDGLPPRDIKSIIEIIEKDMNEAKDQNALKENGELQKLDRPITIKDLFRSMEEKPLGAASIAQVHKATLLDGREVVVKVQYPEVAANYTADFDNMETVAKLLQFKESVETIRALRMRHEFELDFRLEAENLSECGRNALKHGFSPDKVRLPAVIKNLPATKHVLVMEYLDGRSMSHAINEEMTEIAKALGLKGGVHELRKQTMQAIKANFREGGVANRSSDKTTITPPTSKRGNQTAVPGIVDGNGSELLNMMSVSNDRLGDGFGARVFQWMILDHLGSSMTLLRTYVSMRQSLLNAGEVISERYLQLKAFLFQLLGFGLLIPVDGNSNNSSSHRKHKSSKVNLDEKLKDMVQFHGYQLLFDGVFNADPHPGNILLLPDGSLGLIDYGIVGRLTLEERIKVAKVIIALANDDLEEAGRIYVDSGYHLVDIRGNDRPLQLIGRVARFHLDKMDLSLIQMDKNSTDQRKTFGAEEVSSTKQPIKPNSTNTKPESVLRVLRGSIELFVPDWVLQSRRLGGLLIGVSTQAARPVSLAKEWEPLARKLLEEQGQLPMTSASASHVK